MQNSIRAHIRDLLAREDLWNRFPIGIALWDASGRLLHANAVLLSWLQRSEHEVLGRTMDELAEGGGWRPTRWEDVQAGTFETPKISRMQPRSGTMRFVESHVFRCIDAHGDFTGAFQIVLDRTHRYVAERNARLAVAGEVAAAIAHELKNHLAAALGYLDLLERFVDGRGQHLIHNVRRNLTAMRDHAQRLLASGRRTEAAPGPVSVEQVLVSALATVMPQAAARGVYLDVSLPSRELRVSGHPVRLEQVFVNVLLNAIEASRQGDQVSLAVELGDTGVEVVIRDHGPGIPPDVLRRVGEPFFSTKAEGSGLGVFLCREILADYGGWLAFRSHPGKGTEARITLALAPATPVPASQSSVGA